MDPESQELQLRRAGVPWENLFRDIGVSGSTGTQERRGWHRLDNRLAGGDTLVGENYLPDTLRFREGKLHPIRPPHARLDIVELWLSCFITLHA